MLATADAMGWPWSQLAEAEYRLTVARENAAIALEAGDAGEQQHAAWELDEAIRHRRQSLANVADVFQCLLRCAIETGGTGLCELLQRLPIAGTMREVIDRTADLEQSLAIAEKRITELEWALAKLELRV